MELESIGRNIRKFRHLRELRQEDLAEMTGLSTNYIGALERGEKIPSLETLIDILNALSTSADMVLCDVLDEGYRIKTSILQEELSKVSSKDRMMIEDVVSVLIQHSTRGKR